MGVVEWQPCVPFDFVVLLRALGTQPRRRKPLLFMIMKLVCVCRWVCKRRALLVLVQAGVVQHSSLLRHWRWRWAGPGSGVVNKTPGTG